MDVVYIIGRSSKDDLTLIYSNGMLSETQRGLNKQYFDSMPKGNLHSRMKNYTTTQIPDSLPEILKWARPFKEAC